MRVALSEVLGALSYALDLTEGEPPGHAVRTTAIGMRLAEQIALTDEERSSLFYALLLKDAGCSANAARLSSLFAADDHQTKRAMKVTDWSRTGSRALYTWRAAAPGGGPLAKARQMRRITQQEEVTRELIGTRCERGAQIARMLELPEDTAEAIRALDEHWDGSGQPLGLRGEEIPLFGRILCLAQTVEVFVRTVGLGGAVGMALKRRGRWFDPALVDALVAVRDDRGFWAPLEDARCVPPVAAWEPADRVLTAGDERLDRVADAFAQVIDAKSPFTARHSAEVARWAVAIGGVLEMHDEELRDLRRAGLLHDIGKLAMSSRILDKPGRLEPEEMAAIREHPRYTQQILERVACLRGIVETAASHHERLDGAGYHRGLRGVDLSRPARILAVADIYEALTADRPYREAMPRERALAIVREQREVALCPAAVDALEAAAHGWVADVGSGEPRLGRRPRGAPLSATERQRARTPSSVEFLPSTANNSTLDPRTAVEPASLNGRTSIAPVLIHVRLFAGLRERAGTDRLQIELPDDARVADVLAAMASTPVGEIRPKECVVAVNREYAGADEPVHAGDEIALVPPVSGGESPVRRVRVTAEPLDLSALADAVRDPRAGAVVLFEGVTRAVPELDYEAYAEMAQAKIEQIAAEEAERHGLCAVAVEHRTGTVARSEPSVIVAASAPHRGAAFAGARALIDRVKAEAPIWKVEVTAAGRERVEGTLPPT